MFEVHHKCLIRLSTKCCSTVTQHCRPNSACLLELGIRVIFSRTYRTGRTVALRSFNSFTYEVSTIVLTTTEKGKDQEILKRRMW